MKVNFCEIYLKINLMKKETIFQISRFNNKISFLHLRLQSKFVIFVEKPKFYGKSHKFRDFYDNIPLYFIVFWLRSVTTNCNFNNKIKDSQAFNGSHGDVVLNTSWGQIPACLIEIWVYLSIMFSQSSSLQGSVCVQLSNGGHV